jgi:hypothetical protein
MHLRAFEKTLGVTVAAIYDGLSVIYTITSFIDLMVKITIIIIVILVVMVILLFFKCSDLKP